MADKRGQRRKRGTGSIFQRGDGRWCARITLDDGSKQYIYGPTAEDVQARLDEANDNKASGRAAIGSRMKLGEYLVWWHENVRARSLSYNSGKTYRNLITHVDSATARVQLRNLKVHHIYAMIAADERMGLSNTTIRMRVTLVKAALDRAVKLQLIPANPALLVDLPKARSKPRRAMTREQATRFLDAVEESPYYPLWLTLLSTGMRISEALGLTWEAVDLEAGIIHAHFQLERRWGDGAFLKEPKRSQVRNINIGPLLVAVLRRHKVAVRELQLRSTDWHDLNLVFPRDDGTPSYVETQSKRLEKALRDAGLPRFTLHELRHTMATLLLADGEYIKVVQERLGHSNVTTTLSIYGHTSPNMQARAADRIDDLLSGDSKKREKA